MLETPEAETRELETPEFETGVRSVAKPHVSEEHVDDRRPATSPDIEGASSVVQRAALGHGALPARESLEAERATTLVVMEAGAIWPSWVKEVQRRAPNSMVEVQPSSERVESFAARVQRRLASFGQRGVTLVGAVYAAASPATDEERRVRWELCRMLLDTLSPNGELVLSGAGWSNRGVDARSREDLLGLAGDLSCRLKGQTVCVRFSDPSEQSGVHKAPRFPAGLYRRGSQKLA